MARLTCSVTMSGFHMCMCAFLPALQSSLCFLPQKPSLFPVLLLLLPSFFCLILTIL
ncbi:hypothetical protein BCR43DRAFT_140989 [Syncephalastrum racemosum]|uniref:Uncharacterized protein n=1 Tax=Syncephalastrum racemosum TaxID=13706 RepID=A0A1X2HNG7_SYNRA|nr:hypothetical protein BCR43DRAFT_140989 [Syncephalastrum racemosum]